MQAAQPGPAPRRRRLPQRMGAAVPPLLYYSVPLPQRRFRRASFGAAVAQTRLHRCTSAVARCPFVPAAAVVGSSCRGRGCRAYPTPTLRWGREGGCQRSAGGSGGRGGGGAGLRAPFAAVFAVCAILLLLLFGWLRGEDVVADHATDHIGEGVGGRGACGPRRRRLCLLLLLTLLPFAPAWQRPAVLPHDGVRGGTQPAPRSRSRGARHARAGRSAARRGGPWRGRGAERSARRSARPRPRTLR